MQYDCMYISQSNLDILPLNRKQLWEKQDEGMNKDMGPGGDSVEFCLHFNLYYLGDFGNSLKTSISFSVD